MATNTWTYDATTRSFVPDIWEGQKLTTNPTTGELGYYTPDWTKWVMGDDTPLPQKWNPYTGTAEQTANPYEMLSNTGVNKTPELETLAREWMASPEYQELLYGMVGTIRAGGDEPMTLTEAASTINPYVKDSWWEGNVHVTVYRDGTITRNEYEGDSGFGNTLGNIVQFAAPAMIAAITGYGLMAPVAGAGAAGAGTGLAGDIGAWGGTISAADATAAAELGAASTYGTAAGAGMMGAGAGVGLDVGAGISASEAAAANAAASSAMGAEMGGSMTAAELASAAAAGGASAYGAAATGGLTALQKYLLAKRAAGLLGGGGSIPAGISGAEGNYGAGTVETQLKPYKYPTYVQNQQPTFQLPQKPAKTWQEISEEAKQNQKGYYGGFLA